MSNDDRIEHYRHPTATRANIPSTETSSLLARDEAQAPEMKYPIISSFCVELGHAAAVIERIHLR